jgi:hypothetical protein
MDVVGSMTLSAWEQLKEHNKKTPLGIYQQRFSEHPVPSTILKLAANTGNVKLLDQLASEAVKQGAPLRNWDDFIQTCSTQSGPTSRFRTGADTRQDDPADKRHDRHRLS